MNKTVDNRRRPANVRNLLVIIGLVVLAAVYSYGSFLEKSREVESFDEFTQRLADVRVSITQLEYLMDMFVVAGRFENTTVAMITGDVKKLNEKIEGSLGERKYMQLIKSNVPTYENAASINADWTAIKREIAHLNSTFSKDELLLLHNSVDMNTVLIIEKIDRLLVGIAERRSAIFLDLKALVRYNIAGFMVASLVCVLFIFKRFITPINASIRSAEKITAGDIGVRFGEEGGNMGYLGASLNAMLSAVESVSAEKDAKVDSLGRELNNRTRQIEAVNIIMSFAGRSLSQNELYGVAAKETTATGCADAVVIYISEDGSLRLKASSGIGNSAPAKLTSKLKSIIEERPDMSGSVLFKNTDEFPEPELKGFLIKDNFASLISVPIAYNNDIAGFFVAAYASKVTVPGNRLFFLESIAASLAVSTGHVNMFQKEFNFRRFYERILQQEPFGVVVLDRTGTCVFANAALKKLFGADPKLDFQIHYKIFEDESMMKSEFKKIAIKTFEGYASEFEIDYNPSLMMKLGFFGVEKRLNVKARPLFDSGGEISCILLIFNECGRESAATAGGENSK